MFNGRRIDLEQLVSKAHALWEARNGMEARSRMSELFGHAALLSLFVVIVSAANQLGQLQFQARELPFVLLPFAIVGIALLILRRINIQINVQLPSMQLPFDAAPFMQRASLRTTEVIARIEALVQSLPLPHAQIEQSEAIQSVLLFAQRMTRSWLELRAALEDLIEHANLAAPIRFDLDSFPFHTLAHHADLLTRQPRVVVMRC